MVAAVEAIGLCSSILAANLVFAPRRLSKGFNSMEENPGYALGNLVVCTGQTTKGIRSVLGIMEGLDKAAEETAKLSSETSAAKNIMGEAAKAAETAKAVAKPSRFLNGFKTFANFAADHVNPLICATAALKVANSDEDTLTAVTREGTSLVFMFTGERLASELVDMPRFKIVDGKRIVDNRVISGKPNLFVKKQFDALQDYCSTKKLFKKIPMKGLPSILRGLIFVTASICFYNLGEKVGDAVLGKEKHGRPAKQK